jgi:hypothetical protein
MAAMKFALVAIFLVLVAAVVFTPERRYPNGKYESTCGFVMAILAARSEDAFSRDDQVRWKSECEHHPVIARCEDANDTIAKLRQMRPLHCVGQG